MWEITIIWDWQCLKPINLCLVIIYRNMWAHMVGWPGMLGGACNFDHLSCHNLNFVIMTTTCSCIIWSTLILLKLSWQKIVWEMYKSSNSKCAYNYPKVQFSIWDNVTGKHNWMIDIWKTNAQNFTRIGVHMYEGCQNFRPFKFNCLHASKFRWVAQKTSCGRCNHHKTTILPNQLTPSHPTN